MKKVLAILTILMLGLSQTAFAGGIMMPDAAMEGIAAGDWVVITDADGNQSVVDVWYSNNDIALQDESQTLLQAVNQANVVDSAVAVQTNVSSVTTGTPTENIGINQSNTADLTNYNPSNETSASQIDSESCSLTSDKTETFNLNFALGCSESESESFSSAEVLTYDETLDVAASSSSASEDESKSGGGEAVSACALVVDYDKDIDYNKTCSASESESASKTITLDIVKVEECSLTASESESHETSTTSRSNLSENNHITLEDVSQKSLMAVSNLNAVGSSAAMQTNVASDVGVGGIISQANTATAVNGL